MLNTNTTVYCSVCIEHSICIELGILVSSTHFGNWYPFFYTLILEYSVVASSHYSLSLTRQQYTAVCQPYKTDTAPKDGWLKALPWDSILITYTVLQCIFMFQWWFVWPCSVLTKPSAADRNQGWVSPWTNYCFAQPIWCKLWANNCTNQTLMLRRQGYQGHLIDWCFNWTFHLSGE